MISNFDRLMKKTPHKIANEVISRCSICYYRPCCVEMRKLSNADYDVCKKGFKIFLDMEYGGDRNVQ